MEKENKFTGDKTLPDSGKVKQFKPFYESVLAEQELFTSRPLLRYPGGKTRAVDFIIQFFPFNIQTIVSPFIGGGSIELALSSKGVKVYGYDVFNPLVEFWQCALRQPGSLADEVEKYFPLAKDEFYKLQQTQTTLKTKLQRAAAYYVLNRSSFSGSTLSGGMSPGHPRFTTTAIERLRRFNNPNIIIAKADFKTSLLKHALDFAYLDPPYLIKSTLYGNKGDAHKGFDHEALADILSKRNKWILSYNDCDEIRKMYSQFKMVTPGWKYGMSKDKSSKELLILSEDVG
ncbi:MAG: DNA adenine methylase [Chitinophagaceae bacterium]|nr:DNA adenine methylase [Chitinophagaceae bacterium]